MIDVATQINAVARTVGSRTLEDGEAKTVLVRQTYDAAVDDIWDACTNADRITRWFLPVRGDLRLGGRYQIEGNAEGEILDCEPPRRLRVTWEYAGDISWVEVRLASAADGRHPSSSSTLRASTPDAGRSSGQALWASAGT